MIELTQDQINQLVLCRAIFGIAPDGTANLEGMTFLESSDMKADEAKSVLRSVNRWLTWQKHDLMESELSG